MNAFHVLGAVLALWALVVTALGLSNHDFPGSREKLVSGISVVLVIAAIAAGIITSATEEEEEEPEGGEAAALSFSR